MGNAIPTASPVGAVHGEPCSMRAVNITQPALGGLPVAQSDGFVLGVPQNGQTFSFGTYLGGQSGEQLLGVDRDPVSGDLAVAELHQVTVSTFRVQRTNADVVDDSSVGRSVIA